MPERDSPKARSTRLFDGPSEAIVAQQRLADALPILVMIADANGVVRFFNRPWYEFTGQSRIERDEADDWRVFMHPDDGPSVQAAWYDAVTRGERVVNMRYRLRRHATGDYRWFAARAVALEDAGGAVAQWVGTAVDVDDEVNARDALQQLLAQQTAVVEVYQRASLPQKLPRVGGLSFDADYRASAEAGLVGGDWYDAAVLLDGRVVFSIGDVLGHGMGAAIEMGRARQSIITVAANVCEPPEILARVNRALYMQKTIATALVGLIDPVTGAVVLCGAGHPRALLASTDGTVREVATKGLPLGVEDEVACEPVRITLHPGDTLVTYTDGLIEFDRDVASAEQRLIAAITDDRGPLEGCAARLREAVMGDAAAPDDVAILILRFDGER